MKTIRDCETQQEKTDLVKNTFLSLGCKVDDTYNFKNAKDKVPFVIIDKNNELYGYKGNLVWNNVQSGGKFDIKCLLEKERDKFIRCIYNKIGLEPLEKYKRNNDPLLAKVIDEKSEYFGYIGKISPSNVRQGQNWDSRTLLRSEWERYIRDYCRKLDYEVIKFPKTINHKILIKTRKGNIWNPKWRDVRRGSRCPLDTKASFGERCLNEIFKLNNIEYEYQKTIWYDDGTWQWMDFYLPKYNLCIEYNGEQHYKEYGNNFGQDFDERLRLDNKKKSYCIENDINYIEIPYTANTVHKICLTVNDILNIQVEIPTELDVQYSELYNDLEIINSYKELKSIHKVAKKFGISATPVHQTLKRHDVDIYGNSIGIVQLSLEGEFIRSWDTIDEAKKTLNTSANLANACKGKLLTSCGYRWMFKDEYEKMDKSKIVPIKVPKKKKIVQFTKDGEFMMEWEDISEASNLLKINYTSIKRVCENNGQTAGGFRWMYKEDFIKSGNERFVVKPKNNEKKNRQTLKLIVQLSLNGELIKVWSSMAEASESLNISASRISMVCKGGYKSKTAGGFIWMHKHDYDKRGFDKEKYRKGKTGKKERNVVQLTLKNEYISTYSSISKAANKTNSRQNGIVEVCRGKYNSAGGYKWMYKEDYEKYIKQSNIS